jgi:hypothetical protein
VPGLRPESNPDPKGGSYLQHTIRGAKGPIPNVDTNRPHQPDSNSGNTGTATPRERADARILLHAVQLNASPRRSGHRHRRRPDTFPRGDAAAEAKPQVEGVEGNMQPKHGPAVIRTRRGTIDLDLAGAPTLASAEGFAP